MTKLPAATLPKLKAALAKGTIPESSDSPGYDDIFDAFGELAMALDEEWANPKASQARRHIAALVGVWESIPFDGVRTGVACNQPGAVTVAIEAADAMKLPTVAKLLRRAQEHIPKAVLDLEDPVERHEWYETPEGEPHAAALETIEEQVNEGAFADELLLGVFKRILAEPDEFFEKH